MDFKALLNNKPLLYGIIGGIVLLLIVIIMTNFTFHSSTSTIPQEKVLTDPFQLLETDSMGKALEIQALLAREGIAAEKSKEGSKISIVLSRYTASQRDRALLTVVSSGLMDKHIGLEIFDKGDFTSTKDDKRIRLARAINGELGRLIRQLPQVDNASVFVSIAEPTIFTSMKKPSTATVQLTVASGVKLDKHIIKAVTNLLLGSVQGLETKHISITDTNGNVYSSIMSPEDDMMSLIEENDRYMKTKVQSQLDKLVGIGSYVVTVSTSVREVPQEKSSIIYDPEAKSVVAEQKFTERLGDQSKDKGTVTNAVSNYLPSGLPQAANSQQDRNYTRQAQEYQYGVSKTQIKEYIGSGTIEEISIAVTLNEGSLPSGISVEELKSLIAKAASPKVKADNVQIAFAENVTPFLSPERPTKLPEPEESGNPWWTIAVLLGVGLLIGLGVITNKAKSLNNKQQQEIEQLRKLSSNQENQLHEVNEKAVMLMAQQEQMAQAIIKEQNAPMLESNLQNTIDNVKEDIQTKYESDELAQYLKSWIESSN